MGHLIGPDGEKDYGDDPQERMICNECQTPRRSSNQPEACHECDSWDFVLESDYDPTPWCHICGARKREQCHCGPLAKND